MARPTTWRERVLRVTATGVLGIWHLRPTACRRRGERLGKCGGCRQRHRRLLRVLAALTGLQLAGIAALVAFGVGAPTCQPPPSLTREEAALYTQPTESPWVPVRQVLTSGQTGLALAYATARGAEVCRYAPNGTLVALMESGFARGGTMYGHAFLTFERQYGTYEELMPIKRHEARHTGQWSVGTALAGPLGFPVAYSVDEVFAPGAYNHFEQAAGLTDGGYEAPDEPSPTVVRVFLAIVLAGLILFERRRIRRHLILLRAHLRAARARASLREHRDLHQLGCPSCGEISVPASSAAATPVPHRPA